MNSFKRREELIQKAEGLVGTLGSDDFLDELVHEVKSQEASEINNQGPKAQAEFLVDELGLDEFEKTLKEIAGDEQPA